MQTDKCKTVCYHDMIEWLIYIIIALPFMWLWSQFTIKSSNIISISSSIIFGDDGIKMCICVLWLTNGHGDTWSADKSAQKKKLWSIATALILEASNLNKENYSSIPIFKLQM